MNEKEELFFKDLLIEALIQRGLKLKDYKILENGNIYIEIIPNLTEIVELSPGLLEDLERKFNITAKVYASEIAHQVNIDMRYKLKDRDYGKSEDSEKSVLYNLGSRTDY